MKTINQNTVDLKPKEKLSISSNKQKDIFTGLSNQLTGQIWLDGLFGIEKENIRVDNKGNLSQTPHPKAFGNKLNHPYITTDFSESQIEMRTPPLPNIKQMLGFLETIHDITSLELKDEYLWPQSIPPILPNDSEIPVAQYDDEGKEAQQYRELLAQKYGPKNQLFSGIHFNLSFGDKLLKTLHSQSNTSLSYEEFKNKAYLKTTRQLLRLRWLYILLYGNSPIVDSSMELRCKLAPEKVEKHVIGLSIRNSCYGYQNLGELYPNYSSVASFKQSIDKMVSEGKITSPKELYSSVRPKFVHHPDSISYIEIRFVDIDPHIKTGISEEALNFLHILALFGLLTEEPNSFDEPAQSLANEYNWYVSLYGLNSTPFTYDYKCKSINIWKEAQEKLQTIKLLLKNLSVSNNNYINSINKTIELVKNPRQRKVFDVMDGVIKMGYIPYHMQLAQNYLKQSQKKEYNFVGLEDMELSSQLMLREAVKRGISFEILDRKENFVRLKKDNNVQYIKQATKTSLDNYASILSMENKLITKKILEESGLRTPKGFEYTNAENAKADFHLFRGKSVVIKPNQTNFGIGITIIKENTKEEVFYRAIEIAFKSDNTIIIEEFIEGKEFRIFIINDEVVGILHRVPANVVGDGHSSISELVGIKNQDPLRGKGYKTPLEKIQLEEAEAIFLKSQQKDFNYTPKHHEIVYLRENSNISTGGDSIDFTDEIPNSYKQIALKAADALNVKITGLDMIIKDFQQEATDDNYAIIELNFNPAIHIHCHPYKGKNRNLDKKLMDALGY